MESHGASAFVAFGPSHFASLVVIGVLAWAMIRWGSDSEERASVGAKILAFALLAHEIFKTWLWIDFYDQGFAENLPLHLCDAAVVAASVALLTRKQWAYELTYFWGLGGTLQALLTPDIPFGSPHPTFFTFMTSHGLVVIAALYATFVFRLRPYPISILRVWLATHLYALAVTPVNLLLDANYLYLRAKPAQASVIDHLGPWPWYLVALEGIILVSFALYYSPFFLRDRLTDAPFEAADATADEAVPG